MGFQYLKVNILTAVQFYSSAVPGTATVLCMAPCLNNDRDAELSFIQLIIGDAGSWTLSDHILKAYPKDRLSILKYQKNHLTVEIVQILYIYV